MTLELPRDLQNQVETLAAQRGTDAQTIVIEATRAGIGATSGAPAPNGNGPPNGTSADNSGETREQRRARINAAIDAAQADFAHLSGPPFGDAVSELMACKRADEERAEQRGG